METHLDPDTATESPAKRPSQLNLKTADEVYDSLNVPSDKRQEIIKCVKSIYRESAFPDVSFEEIPKENRLEARQKLSKSLKSIHPECGKPWFAIWALWWEHTEPVVRPGNLSQMKADAVYSLLRVHGPKRLAIISCIGLVYKKAEFPDDRFNKLDKAKVKEVESELARRLRGVFADIRRGEPWFPEWALWRRHKTRAESRSRKREESQPKDDTAVPNDTVNWSEADEENDTD